MDKLKHAKHNESVCRFISQKQDYADWVVITAFYSAIHFVEHKIFPYKENGQTFRNMEHYFISVKHNYPPRDKHTWRKDLVAMVCSDISGSYNWLLNTCNTARYSDYHFTEPREITTTAFAHLKKIKEYCSAK